MMKLAFLHRGLNCQKILIFSLKPWGFQIYNRNYTSLRSGAMLPILFVKLPIRAYIY